MRTVLNLFTLLVAVWVCSFWTFFLSGSVLSRGETMSLHHLAHASPWAYLFLSGHLGIDFGLVLLGFYLGCYMWGGAQAPERGSGSSRSSQQQQPLALLAPSRSLTQAASLPQVLAALEHLALRFYLPYLLALALCHAWAVLWTACQPGFSGSLAWVGGLGATGRPQHCGQAWSLPPGAGGDSSPAGASLQGLPPPTGLPLQPHLLASALASPYQLQASGAWTWPGVLLLRSAVALWLALLLAVHGGLRHPLLAACTLAASLASATCWRRGSGSAAASAATAASQRLRAVRAWLLHSAPDLTLLLLLAAWAAWWLGIALIYYPHPSLSLPTVAILYSPRAVASPYYDWCFSASHLRSGAVALGALASRWALHRARSGAATSTSGVRALGLAAACVCFWGACSDVSQWQWQAQVGAAGTARTTPGPVQRGEQQQQALLPQALRLGLHAPLQCLAFSVLLACVAPSPTLQAALAPAAQGLAALAALAPAAALLQPAFCAALLYWLGRGVWLVQLQQQVVRQQQKGGGGNSSSAGEVLLPAATFTSVTLTPLLLCLLASVLAAVASAYALQGVLNWLSAALQCAGGERGKGRRQQQQQQVEEGLLTAPATTAASRVYLSVPWPEQSPAAATAAASAAGRPATALGWLTHLAQATRFLPAGVTAAPALALPPNALTALQQDSSIEEEEEEQQQQEQQESEEESEEALLQQLQQQDSVGPGERLVRALTLAIMQRLHREALAAALAHAPPSAAPAGSLAAGSAPVSRRLRLPLSALLPSLPPPGMEGLLLGWASPAVAPPPSAAATTGPLAATPAAHVLPHLLSAGVGLAMRWAQVVRAPDTALAAAAHMLGDVLRDAEGVLWEGGGGGGVPVLAPRFLGKGGSAGEVSVAAAGLVALLEVAVAVLQAEGGGEEGGQEEQEGGGGSRVPV